MQAGDFLTSPDEVGELVVGVHELKPICLADVAEIREGPDQPESYVWFGSGPAAPEKGIAYWGASRRR